MADKVDALKWVADLLLSEEPHRHHRHCVHNLSYEQQYANRKRRSNGEEWTDEEMRLFKLDQGIVVITPDDWEIDAPDLDMSRLGLDQEDTPATEQVAQRCWCGGAAGDGYSHLLGEGIHCRIEEPQ